MFVGRQGAFTLVKLNYLRSSLRPAQPESPPEKPLDESDGLGPLSVSNGLDGVLVLQESVSESERERQEAWPRLRITMQLLSPDLRNQFRNHVSSFTAFCSKPR